MLTKKQQKIRNLIPESADLKLLSEENCRKINRGLHINFFGLFHVDGVLDGVKGNTTSHWSWKHK